MPTIHPPKLVSALTPTSRSALERDVGDVMSAQHYEVCLEHWIRALLAEPGSDVETWVRLRRLDLGPVHAVLQDTLRDLI